MRRGSWVATLSRESAPGYRRRAPRLPPDAPRPAIPRRRTVVTANGTAPTPTIRVSTPRSAQPATCSRTCSTVPTRRPSRHSASEIVVEHAGRGRRPQALEAPLEVALVLAAQRVEPERAGHRRRIAVAPRRTPGPARRVARGTRRASTTQQVFHPSACPATSARRRSPFPPTMIGGVGCCRAAAVVAGLERPVVAPVEGERTAAEETAQHLDRLARAARAAPPGSASPCRSPRTPVRTNRRRRRRRDDRRRCDRGWPTTWRAPRRGAAPRTVRACRAAAG